LIVLLSPLHALSITAAKDALGSQLEERGWEWRGGDGESGEVEMGRVERLGEAICGGNRWRV
jgi:hypothetical protein